MTPAFVAAQPLERLFVSSVTLAAVRFGIDLLHDVSIRAELKEWLDHKVRPMFEPRILPVFEDVMFKWPVLMEDGRKAGHTYSRPDLIIAATALHHGLAIVSRYTTDFASQQPVGLKHLICGYGIFAAALGG